ncbi:tetrapyrrole methylase [Dendrothele bispora CBS 962.96]|uniref:Methyltransferase/ribosomally synthesized cyclic peptide dendrothelin A precursor dbihMA n=3 Tax=Dendrothele bispora (strain CBS 962.96) TaxID=1314807 RepID=DBIMA_DENBC|nr:RecName: Full=Methyltransferase/ribosomally synthesized cyclic peptide dendrothelin A precursor dbihMA; AltName: Full=Dendrothelin A biosynthesis cluster protein MA; Contains: RecName: Full=N-methyltranferase dbiM; Contains: RecName: Full=Ribosomally synthesized cyclic peptide dendrothelin core peptide; Contains: RecName: Full=Follower peptide; Flags: Precursor [Dendrothele bispora CBS 962.96]THU83556.1 tetrapyrrole methylase [Dendrothele bispora CBS 962.96]
MESSTQTKPGSLIVVGTGIESIGQMTLQALSYIEAASKVFYCVIDPATEAFILTKNKNCVDLYQYYDNGKSRMDTYTQMAELMLKEVRNGLDVVGVFYGHPGVFVNPSHRALAIARSEGYQARMLPGVSAEDCLFADLCIDPSNPGCLTYEASDFLIRERPVNVHSHLILFQVGCVGIADFNFSGFDNSKFTILVDRLEQEYGPDHTVVHYIAAMMPHQDPVTDKFTIGQLREPEIAKRVGGVSTFYIPPKARKDINTDIIRLLEFLPAGKVPDKHTQIYPPNQWEPDVPTLPPYGQNEQAAITRLEAHAPPEEYQPLATSKAMTDVMTKLALDPKALAEYKADHRAFAQSVPDLTPQERAALELGDSWAIRCAMKNMPSSLLEAASQSVEEASMNGFPWVIVTGIVGVIGSVVSSA